MSRPKNLVDLLLSLLSSQKGTKITVQHPIEASVRQTPQLMKTNNPFVFFVFFFTRVQWKRLKFTKINQRSNELLCQLVARLTSFKFSFGFAIFDGSSQKTLMLILLNIRSRNDYFSLELMNCEDILTFYCKH